MEVKKRVISSTTGAGTSSNVDATRTTTTTTTTLPPTPSRSLKFCLLACETKPPYGPVDHTAELMLDLICMAAQKHDSSVEWTIVIHIYNAQAQEYPNNSFEVFDGYFIPGSFSSAYDDDPWIVTLKQYMQTEIVTKQLPTLGICFGHQLLAHSFDDGNTTPSPSGACIGRLTTTCTVSGKTLLKKETMDLYCTHGDIVETLPACAVSLAGDDQVPIQVAAYFASADAAQRFQETAVYVDDDDNNIVDRPSPFAITFQGHPEYATSQTLGLERTFECCLDAMEQSGKVDPAIRSRVSCDAKETFASVQCDSIDAIVQLGRCLGWFAAATAAASTNTGDQVSHAVLL